MFILLIYNECICRTLSLETSLFFTTELVINGKCIINIGINLILEC